MEGYYIVRTYRAGDVGEKIKFWVPGPRPSKVRRRDTREVDRIEKKNRGQAVKVLARLMNANFRRGDLLLTLTYDDEHLPADREEARHRMELAIRRVKRAMQREGVPLLYIAVTSDLNPETGEVVRLHHHLVVNRAALPFFREKWGQGDVDREKLWEKQGDRTPMAVYLLSQVRGEKEERKYVSSRNLIRPAPKDRTAQNGALLRCPKGTVLLYMGEVRPYQPQYIRYVFRE